FSSYLIRLFVYFIICHFYHSKIFRLVLLYYIIECKGSYIMQKNVKIIFHIDMNAFYASCAIIKEPYLKDKVFVVGGQTSANRGVISTASYKARKYGIKAAMGLTEALKIY